MACTVYCPSKDGFLPFHSLGMHKCIPILIVSYVGKDTSTYCVHTIPTCKVYQPQDSIWEKGPLWTEWTLIWHYHEQTSILSFKMTHKWLLKWWMDFEHFSIIFQFLCQVVPFVIILPHLGNAIPAYVGKCAPVRLLPRKPNKKKKEACNISGESLSKSHIVMFSRCPFVWC